MHLPRVPSRHEKDLLITAGTLRQQDDPVLFASVLFCESFAQPGSKLLVELPSMMIGGMRTVPQSPGLVLQLPNFLKQRLLVSRLSGHLLLPNEKCGQAIDTPHILSGIVASTL